MDGLDTKFCLLSEAIQILLEEDSIKSKNTKDKKNFAKKRKNQPLTHFLVWDKVSQRRRREIRYITLGPRVTLKMLQKEIERKFIFY